MRLAYFDCPTGIAGNMILGALLDAGLEVDFLKKELQKLQTSNFKNQNNYKLQTSKIKRSGIRGTFFNVKVRNDLPQRTLPEVLSIINKSRLEKDVKRLSARIFRRLAKAEAKVHGQPFNKVHFHDVGAIDAIIDIVGAVIGLKKLGIEKIYCSPLPHGYGFIKHAHGLLPNPAPATVELLKGVPTYGVDIKGELVTPTGAAIISTLAEDFVNVPKLKVSAIGYGAGSDNLPVPNLLRLFIGEAIIPTERDAILQIETNIDDMDPKQYARVIKKLMQAGALDAYITPIMMKKERQAVNLIILCIPERRQELLNKLFTFTTTLGARVYLVTREKLARKHVKVRTKYGRARVKLGLLGKKIKTIAPEYEDYKLLAKKHSIPIKHVYSAVRSQLFKD